MKNKIRQILEVGAAHALAAFITYILLGVGLIVFAAWLATDNGNEPDGLGLLLVVALFSFLIHCIASCGISSCLHLVLRRRKHPVIFFVSVSCIALALPCTLVWRNVTEDEPDQLLFTLWAITIYFIVYWGLFEIFRLMTKRRTKLHNNDRVRTAP